MNTWREEWRSNHGHPRLERSITTPVSASTQAVAAWFGARLAQRIAADNLSRVFACALALTGVVMLRSSLGWP